MTARRIAGAPGPWRSTCALLPNTCTNEARVRYLVDLVTPSSGTVCRGDMAPFQAAGRSTP